MDPRPKVIRDGKVAVLFSPGRGAGWYSWNTQHKDCLTDPDIVALVERLNLADNVTDKYNINKQIELLAIAKWPDFYFGGSSRLHIYWIEADTMFRIDEYDGNESVVLASDDDWIVP